MVHCAAAAVLFSFSLLSCSRYREICFSTFPTPNFLQSLHQPLNYLIKSTLLGGISTQTWEHDILKRPYPAAVTPPHQISTLMNKSLTLYEATWALFWPSTIKYQLVLPYTDPLSPSNKLVPPYTHPVPPNTIQYHSVLTPYHDVPTFFFLAKSKIFNRLCVTLFMNHLQYTWSSFYRT